MNYDSSFDPSLSTNIPNPSSFQDQDQLRQHLLPTLKNWFTSDQRQVHVLAITPGGGKTYTTAQALVESCHENLGFVGMLAIHTKKRIKQELESIKQIKQQLESVGDKPKVEIITILGKDKNQSSGYCRNYSEANRLDMAGFSAKHLLCQSRCEFRQECLADGYLSQFELPLDDQSRICVTTHQSAKNWAEFFRPNVIVFDEYPIGINLNQNELTEKDLADYRNSVKQLNGQDFNLVLIFLKVLRKIIKKHSQIESNRSFLRDQQVRQLFSDHLSKKYGHQVRDSFFNDSHQWRDQLLLCQRIFLHQNNPAFTKSKARSVIPVFSN